MITRRQPVSSVARIVLVTSTSTTASWNSAARSSRERSRAPSSSSSIFATSSERAVLRPLKEKSNQAGSSGPSAVLSIGRGSE
jgi:hypothetical protein